MISEQWRKLGKALNANADEIDQLYLSFESELELENTTSGWQFLVEHGLILGNLHTGYSPSTLILQLGDILSLAKNRQAQTPDISEWRENLKRLIKRYHLAKDEQDDIGQLILKRDIHSNVLFMQTSLEGEINQLEYFIDNKFGHVNSLKAKQHENEYCIERASRSAEKLTFINEMEITQLCGNDMELLQVFLRKLLPTVKDCRDRLLAAIPRLKNILWEYRKIDQRTHLVQVMHNYLQNGGSLSGSTMSEKQMSLSPFNSVTSITIKSSVDVLDRSKQVEISDIVKSMRPNHYKNAFVEKETIESHSVQIDEREKIKIPEPLLRPFLQKFVKSLEQGKQSARYFWEQQLTDIVPTGIWIWWLHIQFQQANNPTIILNPSYLAPSRLSANLIITDLIVEREINKNESL